MSGLTTIETDLGKVGHAFVIGAEKLKAAIIGAAGVIDKAAPEIATIEGVANSVAEQIYPGAGLVAGAIEGAMSKVFTAVDSAAAAAGADGMNIQLDQATVTAIKAALPTVKAQATTTPGA